jgi:hypothetical protein
VTELVTDSDYGYAIVEGQAVRFAPFADAPVEKAPDAAHVGRSGHVVIARERALLFASESDWTKTYRELAWSEPILAIAANDDFVAVADRASVTLLDGRLNSVRTHASVPAPGVISGLEVLRDGSVLAFDGSGAGWTIDFRRRLSQPLAGKASLIAAGHHVFYVFGREVSEYDARKKTATPVGRIGSGARSVDTWGEYVAFGLESGEVVLGTRRGGKLETLRLVATR